MTVSFPIAAILFCGCKTPQNSSNSAQVATLSREVLVAYRARASEEELRQFDKFRASPESTVREHAAEMVLFKLNQKELRKIGLVDWFVIPEDQAHPDLWVVASCWDAWEKKPGEFRKPARDVNEVLHRERILLGVNGSFNCVKWVVPREYFFRARRALLTAKPRLSREVWVNQSPLIFE